MGSKVYKRNSILLIVFPIVSSERIFQSQVHPESFSTLSVTSSKMGIHVCFLPLIWCVKLYIVQFVCSYIAPFVHFSPIALSIISIFMFVYVVSPLVEQCLNVLIK